MDFPQAQFNLMYDTVWGQFRGYEHAANAAFLFSHIGQVRQVLYPHSVYVFTFPRKNLSSARPHKFSCHFFFAGNSGTKQLFFALSKMIVDIH